MESALLRFHATVYETVRERIVSAPQLVPAGRPIAANSFWFCRTCHRSRITLTVLTRCRCQSGTG